MDPAQAYVLMNRVASDLIEAPSQGRIGRVGNLSQELDREFIVQVRLNITLAVLDHFLSVVVVAHGLTFLSVLSVLYPSLYRKSCSTEVGHCSIYCEGFCSHSGPLFAHFRKDECAFFALFLLILHGIFGIKFKNRICSLRSAGQHTRFSCATDHRHTLPAIAPFRWVVSLLTRVRAAEPGMLLRLRNAPSLPTCHHQSCSGSLSAHIHRMLRGFLTLTAPGTRGFSPHSVYARP